jgi:hypothetical protein
MGQLSITNFNRIMRARDGDRPSLKLKRVILGVEILDANQIAFHGHQDCHELFDLGAFRGVAFH